MTGDVPLIYLTAGEPSGDQLGAHLMRALREETGGKIAFAGVGGERMLAEGLESLFPMREISYMGLDYLPHLRTVLRRIRETADDVVARAPAALVTIDAQGFSARVGKQVRPRLERPIIHYVAPTVWAYKAGRAARAAGYLDRILAIFPFEPPYFEPHGLEVTFVGHPAAEAAGVTADGNAFRAAHDIAPEATVISTLPGSRRGEIQRMGPLFTEIVTRISETLGNLHCVLPTVDPVAEQVEALVKAWPCPVTVLRHAKDKYAAFAASDIALATSGTITVETAFADLPTVVVYKANPVVARIVTTFNILKVKYASGVNLVLDKPTLPEFIQNDATPAPVVGEVLRLLRDEPARAEMRRDLAAARGLLQHGAERPSVVAARAVLDEIARFPAGRRATRSDNGRKRP